MFEVYRKVIQFYIYINMYYIQYILYLIIYVYMFFQIIIHYSYYKILNIVPCAIQ